MTEEESRLFEAFVRVRKADNVTPEKAPVPGIGTRTLRRYIVDGEVPTRLEDDTKAAMARFLASRGVAGFESFLPRNGLEPATDAEVIDLGARLDQIESSDLDPVLKIIKIEALSAAIRAEQARHEALAAATRARAIEKAESSAVSRATALERAEESASVRSLALHGGANSDLAEEREAVLRTWGTFHRLLREAGVVTTTERPKRPDPGPSGEAEKDPPADRQ